MRAKAHVGAVVLLTFAACLSGCAHLPRITRSATEAERATLRARCKALFPRGAWRTVHAIRARLPFGYRTAFIGIVQGDPPSRRLRLMVVALEGVTLLDVSSYRDDIRVRKAVPPLDRAGVARGFVQDVKLLLFEPGPSPRVVGILPGGSAVCRYADQRGTTVDVLPGVRVWRIHLYDSRHRLQRRVEATGFASGGFSSRVRLEAPGVTGYSLDLHLLRVEARRDAASITSPRPLDNAARPPAPTPEARQPRPSPRQ